MRRVFEFASFLSVACLLLAATDAQASRRSRPWPDVSLSTLPSVVGATNSWVYEINQRSPAYLADLDKMYVSIAYGWGKSNNNLSSGDPTKDGYAFYDARLDHRIYDFKFNIYSNLGKTTFGSLWVSYAKYKSSSSKESIVPSTPSSMMVKTAFAWQVLPKVTLALSGSITNWPRSLVLVFQPKDDQNYGQRELPADVGENLVGEFDVMYRPKPGLDIIVGGVFQNIYTKFNPPHESPFESDGSVSTRKDTAEVKEYIYSGAPRFSVKKTFASGDFVRVGGAYYFNLFDYQYEGARELSEPSPIIPSYRLQEFSSFIPKWRLFADGSKTLGSRGALYLAGELGSYPNYLEIKDTEWAPLSQSLVKLVDLSSGSVTCELSTKLTRILNAMAGFEMRFLKKDDESDYLDDRSVYATLKLGATTRFYRNLWWSIRIPEIRLYSSEALGSSILFENRSYIETEILFVGL